MTREAPPLPWGTIDAILQELERAGFTRGDDVHVGRAISLLRQIGKIYSGQRDQIDDVAPKRAGGRPAGPAVLALVPRDSDRPMTAGGWLSGPMP
jgi:hypothetical protein